MFFVTENGIVIKNGYVYDFGGNVDGDKKDIFIVGGKITDSEPADAEVIDASGKIVMPGFAAFSRGFFGPMAGFIRSLASESDIKGCIPPTSIATTLLKSGITFVAELGAPLSHYAMILSNSSGLYPPDFGVIPDLGSNWLFFADLASDDHVGNITSILKVLIPDFGALGAMLGHPFHDQFWSGDIPSDIPFKIPHFNLDVSEIYIRFIKAFGDIGISAVPILGLYGHNGDPKLYGEIRDRTGGKFAVLLTDGDDYISPEPENRIYIITDPIISEGNFPFITSDRNSAIAASESSGVPVTSLDLEFEAEYYITVRSVDRKKVEENCRRFFGYLSENVSSGKISGISASPFLCGGTDPVDFPKLLAYTVSSTARSGALGIDGGDDVIGLKEVTSLFSRAPFEILGLGGIKGTLKPGYDADVIILPVSPDEITGNDAVNAAVSAFSAITVIKGGTVVIKDGKPTERGTGRMLGASVNITEGDRKVMEMKKKLFIKHHSMYYGDIKPKLPSNFGTIGG